MGASNRQALTLVAKMNGGKQIADEADTGKRGVKGLREEVERTDRVAGDPKGFVRYEEQQKRTTKHVEKHHEVLKKSRGLIENVLGAVGLTAGAAGFTSLIKAGAATEAQETSLQGALRRTGQTHAGVMGEINHRVERSALSGGFMANEQLQGITQFVGVTHNLTKAMKMNEAATNLARGAHIGFAQAQKMLLQGTSGSIGQLQKYLGPIVATHKNMEALTGSIAAQTLAAHRQDQVWKMQHPHAILLAEAMKKATPAQKEHAKLLDKQAESTKILALIQGRFAGEQANYDKTNAAQLSNMHNRLDITQATIGKKLLPLFLKAEKAVSKFALAFIKDFPAVWAVVGPPIKYVGHALVAMVHGLTDSSTKLKILGGLLVIGASAWLGYKTVVGAVNLAETVSNDLTKLKYFWLGLQNIAVAEAEVELGGYTAGQWLANAALAAFPVVAVIAGLVALGVGIYMLIKHWHDVWNVLKEIGKWILAHAIFIPVLGPAIFVVKQIVEHWSGLIHFFESLPGKMLNIGKSIGMAMWEGIKGYLNSIIGGFDELLHWAHMLYRKVPDPLGILPAWPISDPAIPKLAAGGRLLRGGMALIGERGPEILNLPTGARVEPLRNQGGTPGVNSLFEAISGDMHVHLDVEGKEIASVVLKDFRKKNARM